MGLSLLAGRLAGGSRHLGLRQARQTKAYEDIIATQPPSDALYGFEVF